MEDILDKQDALELDQEEINQLLKVLEDCLKGLLGDSVVTTRAESTSDSALENEMASQLDGGSHCTQLLTDPSVDRGSRDHSPPNDMYRNLKTQRMRGINRAANMRQITLA